MTWLLFDPGGTCIASGSWHGVIREGEELGALERRYSSRDGSEACPRLRPGYMIVPEPMFEPAPAQADFFPEPAECVRYG